MGTGLWMPAAMMLVLFIIGTVNTYLQLYMCMAIGGQWPTSRLGASIAAYFILNFGLQMLTVAGKMCIRDRCNTAKRIENAYGGLWGFSSS